MFYKKVCVFFVNIVAYIVAQTAAVIVSIDSNFLMFNMFYDYSDASISPFIAAMSSAEDTTL